MVIIRIDFTKYLGKSVLMLLTNGQTKRMAVRNVQTEWPGTEKETVIISGYDEEGLNYSLNKNEIEMVID